LQIHLAVRAGDDPDRAHARADLDRAYADDRVRFSPSSYRPVELYQAKLRALKPPMPLTMSSSPAPPSGAKEIDAAEITANEDDRIVGAKYTAPSRLPVQCSSRIGDAVAYDILASVSEPPAVRMSTA
jgi:hypothetical protein